MGDYGNKSLFAPGLGRERKRRARQRGLSPYCLSNTYVPFLLSKRNGVTDGDAWMGGRYGEE